MARRRTELDVLPAGSEVLLDRATDHGHLRIEQDPSRPSGRIVFLDGVACSYVDLDDPRHLEFSYIQRFADLLEAWRPAPAPLRVTHVGGGAVSLPRYLADTRPQAQQTVYEHDGALIEITRAELGLRTHPGLRVKIGDARPRMERRSPGSADVVVGDAFSGRTVPLTLASVEYVRLVQQVLADDGIYLLNVIGDRDLGTARRHAATLRAVFRTVLLTADPDVLAGRATGNLVYLATDTPVRELPLGAIQRACTRGAYPDRVIGPDELGAFAADARPISERRER